jgi:hypothetical protein
MGVAIDKEPVILPEDPTASAALLVFENYRLRMMAKNPNPFTLEILRDLDTRREHHCHFIEQRLLTLREKLGGFKFLSMGIWEHIELVLDDPNVVLYSGPPYVEGDYETHVYGTKDRMTWNEPTYRMWSPGTDVAKLFEMAQDAPALILIEYAAKRGESVGHTIHAQKYQNGDSITYISTNQPDEVLEVIGRPQGGTRKGETLEKPIPIVPIDFDPTDTSTLKVVELEAKFSGYYRRLWMHNVRPVGGQYHYGVVVDGYMVAVGGFETGNMGYRAGSNGPPADGPSLVYSLAPSTERYRYQRLAEMVGCQGWLIERIIDPFIRARSQFVYSTMLTKHPESKLYRGLKNWTLQGRFKNDTSNPWSKGRTYRLVYRSPVMDQSTEDILALWLKLERNRQKERAKIPTAANTAVE